MLKHYSGEILLLRWTWLLALLVVLPLAGWAQTPVTVAAAPYAENFDAQGATGTVYAAGWTGIKASGTSTTVTNGAVIAPVMTDGFVDLGATYNVGTASAIDWALGSPASASIIPRFGAVFQNASGANVTQVDLAASWSSGARAAAMP